MSATTRWPCVRPMSVLVTGIATLICSLAISSCGGGGGVGSGGTGAPQTSLGAGSYSSGTVTGFGSLVVDGIAYTDTQVPVTTEAQPDVHTPDTARLGHFTELEFAEGSGQEVLRAIRIEAAVAGRIDAVDAATHSITVLGQTIVENTSREGGPVTYYSGVSRLAALRAGDAVEVHGVPRWNESSGRYEVMAARIEKRAAAFATQRVAGVVQNSGASGMNRSFRLGGLQVTYSAASMLPADAVARDGDRVVVWSDQPPVAGSLAANAVRVVARSLPAPGKAARIGGTVSRLDTSSQRFDLAGVTVLYENAKVTPNGKGFELENSVYVVVDGTYAADGTLEAKHIKLRKHGAPDDVDVELTGPIENFIGVASFTVRGTPVDALGASLQGCGNATLRDALNVRIEGRVQAGAAGSVVKAETVRCVS